jgi:transcription initiation factor TFIIIB Brf1 subunit/transcription initiation factor TFIIB
LAPTTAMTGVLAFSAVRIILAIEARSITSTRMPLALSAAAVYTNSSSSSSGSVIVGM